MKKCLALVLKLAALVTLLSAAAYAVAVNWDRISEALERLKDALEEWRLCASRHEEDDYADWDECC